MVSLLRPSWGTREFAHGGRAEGVDWSSWAGRTPSCPPGSDPTQHLGPPCLRLHSSRRGKVAGQSCPAWGPAWAAQGMGLSLGPRRTPHPTLPCMGLGPWPAWERQSLVLLAAGCWQPLGLPAQSDHLSGIPMEKPAPAGGPGALRFPSLVVCGCIGPRLGLPGHPHPLPGVGAPTFCWLSSLLSLAWWVCKWRCL